MDDRTTRVARRRLSLREIASAVLFLALVTLLALWPSKRPTGASDHAHARHAASESAQDVAPGARTDEQARHVTSSGPAADDTTADWQRYLEMTHTPLERSPGYARPYDPEWRSVVRGRRDAPEISLPLEGGTASLESLAQAVLDAASREDVKALRALHVTEEEFTKIMWPEFPQSRPITHALPQDAWILIEGDMVSGIDSAISLCAGHSYALVAVKVEKTEEFRNFTLYRRLTFEVRDSDGTTRTLRRVRQAVERKGRFKVSHYEE